MIIWQKPDARYLETIKKVSHSKYTIIAVLALVLGSTAIMGRNRSRCLGRLAKTIGKQSSRGQFRKNFRLCRWPVKGETIVTEQKIEISLLKRGRK
jgi:lauroyl/myristoyl acyltransferase